MIKTVLSPEAVAITTDNSLRSHEPKRETPRSIKSDVNIADNSLRSHETPRSIKSDANITDNSYTSHEPKRERSNLSYVVARGNWEQLMASSKNFQQLMCLIKTLDPQSIQLSFN